ncbi:hypothetical protein CP061683_1321A, partial [Chlamydia psittaci 06-1683]
MADKEPRE